MQYLVILALLFLLLAWLANAYHHLAQLRRVIAQTWVRCRSALKERNAALRELRYLLTVQEAGGENTLRQLKHIESDLETSLAHADLKQLQSNEQHLQALLLHLQQELPPAVILSSDQTQEPLTALQQAYHLVLLYDEARRAQQKRYNEVVLRYNQMLSLGVNRLLGGIFHFHPIELLGLA